MDQNLITIILPIFNAGKTLEHALTSIQRQIFTDWKLICVDDGSTDNTPVILTSWQEKLDAKMQIITNQQNLGLTRSLNKAIKLANTNYIARLDADDWWTPDKLEKQNAFLKNHPDIGLLGCNYVNHYHKGVKINLPTNNQQIKKQIFYRNPFGHSCVIFKKDLWQKVGGYNETLRYGQDYHLWLRFLPHTNFHNLPDYLCHRLVKPDTKKQKSQMLQMIKTLAPYSYHPRAWLGLLHAAIIVAFLPLKR